MNELETRDINFRNSITAAVEYMSTSPDQIQIHVEPVHRFADGLYSREFTMPAGSNWVSRVHKRENFAFIIKGSCTVVSENGAIYYEAPQMLKTLAGTQRFLKIHEECTWVTVHAKPEELGEDIDRIEDYFACFTMAEYDQHLIAEQGKLL
jgi:quercetin dioxygenase-like cupin family protein